MEKSILKYLADFSEKTSEYYGDTIHPNVFFNDADNEKLTVREDFSWLNDFARAIENIQSLLLHEHIHVKYVKELRRAESASRVDSEAFYMTVKEPRLWRKVPGGLAPESVYHNAFEDEHAIYENRFIKQLIDEIIRYLSETLTERAASFGSLQSYFNSNLNTSGALRFSEDSIVNTNESHILATEKDPEISRFDEINTLLKKTLRFKRSTLYIECAKLPPVSAAITATNILIHDKHYRACYFFYKKLRHLRMQDTDSNNALFNCVFLKLLYSMHRSGYRVPNDDAINVRNGRLECTELTMEKGDFSVTLKPRDNDEIILSVFINKEKSKSENTDADSEYASAVLIKVTEFISDNSEKQITEYRKSKLKDKFNDAYLFVLSHLPTMIDGVINLANNGEPYSRAAEDFIHSLTLLLDGSHKVFGTRCPICGSKYVDKSETYSVCRQCGGQWSLIKVNGDEKIWVKRIRS